ncbi:hypothetical protein Hanom_Chr00s000001g01598571 [Helianthus anomalus]
MVNQMLAKNQIESYTTQAWFSEDKELEEKVSCNKKTTFRLYGTLKSVFCEQVAKISLETGTVSEYTHMIMLKTEPHYKPSKSGKTGKKQGKKKPDQEGLKTEKIYTLHHLGLGFGNMVATFENIPPRFVRAPSQTDKIVSATSNCCADVFSKCCCMCCIQACSRINNQCSVVLTQTCGFLTCSACCE